MLSRLAAARSSFAIISSARRSKMGQTVRMPAGRTTTTRRNMAGGGAAMEGSPQIMHTASEVFGVIAWLWIFSRAREDLPWLLGFRHPWEHAEDPFAPSHHDDSHGKSQSKEEMTESWDKFTMKSVKSGEDDDDEDEEDDEEDDEGDE